MSLGRCEHDVELVEAAEVFDEGAKRGDDLAGARQQAQDVGVEGQTGGAEHRQRGEADGRERHEHTAPVGPRKQ